MNEQLQTLAIVMTALGALLGGMAAYRKWGPEARKINVDVMDVNVRVAGDLRDDALEEMRRYRADMLALREEFNQYRSDTERHLAEMSAALRGKVAENRHLKAELKRRDADIAERDSRIDELRDRIVELEREVAGLKHLGPHSP